MPNAKSRIEEAFQTWYESLKPLKQYAGRPAKGTIAAALVVLERLRHDCDLRIGGHLAKGGAQIAGLSSPALRKILERFGETRPFPSEAGRTNRGNNQAIERLLKALADSGLGALAENARNESIDELQKKLVCSLDAYYKLERIRFDFDSMKPAQVIIGEILGEAQKRNQAGPVAQHLVGAKLAMRFPHITISNYPYSAPDDQAGRPGDFRVGNTAFHVTVAPNLGHMQRCAQNLKEGLAACLLVSDVKLAAARALLENEGLETRVAVQSVESFVGQNLSELSEFAVANLVEKLGDLLDEYNRRVVQVETDDSLLIDVPTASRRPKA